MDWGTLLISLAGILFGGGMIGQLIMFFVKRSDEKKDHKRELYRMVYNKLCDYNTVLENIRLNCFKEIHQYGVHTDAANSTIKDNLQKIDQLIKNIQSYKRKCRKNKNPDCSLCDKCSSDRQLLKELDDRNQELLQKADNYIELMKNYWSNNYEQTYTVLTPYANIENTIYAINGCDKKVQVCIRIIDKSTRGMCSGLLFGSLPKFNFEDELIKQIASISVALQMISKQL